MAFDPDGPHGLIPACAGKTVCPCCSSCVLRAHPRVCGENKAEADLSDLKDGSSPRVRGKPLFNDANRNTNRLIPACAGKTNGPGNQARRAGAHPRVCGENLVILLADPTFPGSSPRVRGKPKGSKGGNGSIGLIPACAGKTCPCVESLNRLRAHPRVCGENSVEAASGSEGHGSSPRVRGKLKVWKLIPSAHGLIPACAGKTSAVLAR